MISWPICRQTTKALVLSETLPDGVNSISDYSQHVYGYSLDIPLLLRKCKIMDALTDVVNPVKPTVRADYKEILDLYTTYKDSLSISETTPWQNLDFAAFSDYVNGHSTIYTSTTATSVRDLLKTTIERTSPYAVTLNTNNINGINNLVDTLISIGAIKDTIIEDWAGVNVLKQLPLLNTGSVPNVIEINLSRPDSVMQLSRERYTVQVTRPKIITDTLNTYYKVHISITKNTADTTSYADTLAFGIKRIEGVLCGPTPLDSVGTYFYMPGSTSASFEYVFEPESCYTNDSITFHIFEHSDSIAIETFVMIPVVVNPTMADGFDITISGATLIERIGAPKASFRTASHKFLDVSTITSVAGTELDNNNLSGGSAMIYKIVSGDPLHPFDMVMTSSYQQMDNAYATPYRPDPGTGFNCDNTDMTKAPYILAELTARNYTNRVMPTDLLVRDTLVNLFNAEFLLSEDWRYYEGLINEIYDNSSNTDCYENQQLGSIALNFLNGILADGAFTSPNTTNLTGESYINSTLYPNIVQQGFQGLYWSSFGTHNGGTPGGYYVAYLTDRFGFACKTIEISAPNSFHFWNLVTGFSNIRPINNTSSTNQFLIDVTFNDAGTPVTIAMNGSFGCGLTFVDCYTEGPKEETILVPAELACSDCITCTEAYDVMNWVYKQIRPSQRDDIDLIESLLRNWADYKDYPTYHYLTAQDVLYAYQQCNQHVECDTTDFAPQAGLIKYAILNFAQDGRLNNNHVFPLSLYPVIATGIGFAPSDTAFYRPTATIYRRSNAIGVTNVQIILDDRIGALAEPEPVINFSYPTEYNPEDFTDLSLKSILPSKDGASTLFEGEMYVTGGNKFKFSGRINISMVTCTYPDTMRICPQDLPLNIPNDSLTCVEDLINSALTNAFNSYQTYLDSLNTAFTLEYKRKCVKATELWDMEYTDKEYHFTLYYYDRAGNLIKTVPPKGVELLGQPDIDDAIDYNNNVPGSTRVPTTHKFNTNYQMNSLNQVLWQKTPDAEYVELYYDQLGRVLLSQSGRQR
ncbi:MAG: hypothetical protein M0D57_08605 [Sphingobacteriales bacterium JAD_PAG50586_3]|nr:MAG: hypothetical protein M0D57_08605 [Sphingobacteriales bacterium JAD_PAG50586_3]